MTNDAAVNRSRPRVRVFIDFWNFTLTMKDIDPSLQVDWSTLGPALARAAVARVNATASGEYQGLNVYGSYDPNGEADRRLHRWATTIVARFPGVSVSFVQRQKKRYPPRCPACHGYVTSCPSCSADMRGTEEKGVDVRLATDMIRLAWFDNYDIAVPVSSDRDFVPVAEFLDTRGIKVIHGAFPPRGADLTRHCWGSIDVAGLQEDFRRT